MGLRKFNKRGFNFFNITPCGEEIGKNLDSAISNYRQPQLCLYRVQSTMVDTLAENSWSWVVVIKLDGASPNVKMLFTLTKKNLRKRARELLPQIYMYNFRKPKE